MRHDFLGELKQKAASVRGDERNFSKSRPLIQAKKRRENESDGKCPPNAGHNQPKVGRTEVSRRGPPIDDRHDKPLKSDRRGIKKKPLRTRECGLGQKVPDANGAAPGNQDAENDKDQDEIPRNRGKVHG